MSDIGLWIAITGTALVLVEAFFAHRNFMFWPWQVERRWKRPGIAFAMHGGMWGDFVLLPALFGYLAGVLVQDWTDGAIVRSAAVGFVLAVGNHVLLCLTQDKPDPMGWKEEWWSTVIALHFIYLWGAVTLAALVLFYSPSASEKVIGLTCVALGVHVWFGMHLPLGILDRYRRFEWCPNFLTPQALQMHVCVWTVLATVCWWRGFSEAFVLVMAVGVALHFATLSVARRPR